MHSSRRYYFVRPREAFTLIELILVMALLSVVIAVAAPTLSHFFHGRKLDSEARRFVALTRYAQNCAVSEGLPMVLWIDQLERTYGLREDDGYALRDLPLQSALVGERKGHEIVDVKQPEFRLAEDLRFELVEGGRTNGRIVTLRFLPDGAIDEGSLRSLLILQENRRKPQEAATDMLWIAQALNRSRYEIVDKTNLLERMDSGTEVPKGIYVR